MSKRSIVISFGDVQEQPVSPEPKNGSGGNAPIYMDVPEEFAVYHEEIMYNSAFRATLRMLEQQLHKTEDTKVIILQTVKTCCLFYDADWCGILLADRNTGVWGPKLWYDRATDGMSPTLFRDNEFFEDFPRWVDALNTGEPVVIPDVEAIKNVSLEEYEGYRRLDVENVIGAPFGEHPTGFLVVRNCKRYKTHPDMVQMLAFVGLSQYYLGEFISIASPEDSLAKKVRINLFGKPSIVYRGIVTDVSGYRAPKGWKLLVYLALSEKPKSAYEIASALWPDDTENQSDNVRGMVYRIRDRLSQKIPANLIINDNGYQLNPELVITTDVQEMESLWKRARDEASVYNRVDLLKKAFSLYTGEVYESCADEEWLNRHVNHYAMMYVEIVNALLEALAGERDYPCIQEYAGKSLVNAPGNEAAYYWLTAALIRSGAVSEARQRVLAAKTALIEEDYNKLVSRLEREFGRLI